MWSQPFGFLHIYKFLQNKKAQLGDFAYVPPNCAFIILIPLLYVLFGASQHTFFEKVKNKTPRKRTVFKDFLNAYNTIPRKIRVI